MKEEIKKIVNGKYFDEWYFLVSNILENKEFQKRIYFTHHKNKSVFEHSIKVSYDAYAFTRNMKIDSKKCAIIGLLHDFYPYLWKDSDMSNILDNKYKIKLNIKKAFFQKHGFVHGMEASVNYLNFFPEYEDYVIADSIKCHMFPLTKPPKYKEGWIITFIDKKNAILDILF